MKRLKALKNKYIITLIVFAIYFFFLDDVDVFSLVRQQKKLHQLKEEKAIVIEKYNQTNTILKELDTSKNALIRYAREEKLFKKDNEDLYVIVYEEE